MLISMIRATSAEPGLLGDIAKDFPGTPVAKAACGVRRGGSSEISSAGPAAPTMSAKSLATHKRILA
jgi:hypothetical protein